MTNPESSASQVSSANTQDFRDQSLAEGRIGDMLVPIERAHRGEDQWPRVRALLAEHLRQPLLAHDTAALYIGAPAVAFAAVAAGPNAGVARALESLDTRIAELTGRRLAAATERMRRGERPHAQEFDLFYGLTGLGVYWLRRDPSSANFHDVLSYLVRLVDPIRDDPDRLPGWWTLHDPSGHQSTAFPYGHANLGMAHGSGGPLALLSLGARAGTVVPGQIDAIDRICATFDAVRHETDTQTWWPYWITSTRQIRGRLGPGEPSRPSWCYGTPGLARAQQLAGIALGDTARQRLAEQALRTCLSDPRQLDQVRDAGLCHGIAGVLHTVARASTDAPPGMFRNDLRDLRGRMLAAPIGTPHGLLGGAPGRELALLTAETGTTASGWDLCLLTG